MIKIHKNSLKFLLFFALLISIAVPIVNVFVIFPSFSKSVVHQAEEEAVKLGSHLAISILDGRETLKKDKVLAWARFEHESFLEDFDLLKIRVFDPAGEIIYSSKASEIGTFNKEPYFFENVAKGEIYTKSAVKEEKTLEGEMAAMDIVETYVPIMVRGSFVGALELYKDVSATGSNLVQTLKLVMGVPIGVMVFFMLGLIVAVFRIDKFILIQEETEKKLVDQQKVLEADKKKQHELFKKVEQAKKEWESTMDCIEDMVMLTDTTFKILRCNKAVINFTKFDYGEILSKRFVDLFPDNQNDQELSFESGCEYYHNESQRWLFLSVYPLKTDDGKLTSLVCTAHDFTAVKLASLQLQKNNIEIDTNRKKLKAALDGISGLIEKVVKEKTFDVAFKNPTLKKCYKVKKCGQQDCPCFGKDPMRCWQVQGTFCQGGIATEDPEKRDCLACDYYNEMMDDPIYQIGEQFNNMMFILAGKNTEVEEAYAELKATQAQLLQQEKMASVGQLAAGVAHEINNPMGFIGSNVSTLRNYIAKLQDFIAQLEDAVKTSVNDEQVLTGIEEVRKNLKLDFVLEDINDLIEESLDGCERVKRIVMDLKGFSRVDLTDQEKIDINSCIDTTLNIARNELKYKTEIIKEYGELEHAECFPQQLNQVFMNILVNAAQSIEEQGTITIKTWNENGNVCITIQDTGSGMPKEVSDKIFEPFYTTKEVGKGTGLGLSIVYDIVTKNHNGEISVESEEGKGTCFTIKIPVKSE